MYRRRESSTWHVSYNSDCARRGAHQSLVQPIFIELLGGGTELDNVETDVNKVLPSQRFYSGGDDSHSK